MKIHLISRHRLNYSNRRFREEAKSLGLKLLVRDPLEYQIVLGRQAPFLYRNGRNIHDVDVVLPRMGSSIHNHGLAVITQFEMLGVPVVNPAMSIIRTRNKLRCIQLMTRSDVDIPRTIVIKKPSELFTAIQMVGGFPVVLKLLSGTQGVGVMLAENMVSIESTLDTLWSLGQDILIQECIKESVGRDIRAIVIGGKVVAAMRRQARIGEFRTNIHRGGIGTTVDLSKEYETASITAAKTVGLGVAGVDLLESHQGPKVIEVNSSPGLEGVETTTGINVAREILEYAISLCSKKKAEHG